MSSYVTLTWLPVKKDADGAAGIAKLEGMQEKLMAASSALHTYRGKGLDANEPEAVEVADVWESPDAVKAAHSSPLGEELKTVTAQLTDTSDPKAKPYHSLVTFNSDFVAVAAAPVVQIGFVFLPLTVDTSDVEAKWNAGLAGLGKPDGLVAGAHGWAAEEYDHDKAGKAKVFVAASGWESAEKANAANEKYKDAEGFAEFSKLAEHRFTRMTALTKLK